MDTSMYEPENRPAATKMLQLRESNVERIGKLEQQGVSLDFLVARVEFFMRDLVKVGVLTDKQLVEMQMGWEKSLTDQLNQIEQQVKKRVEQMKVEIERQQREAALRVGPPGPKDRIILPPGTITKS